MFEQNNLVDIWKIRNSSLKQYTFRKNHFSGFIQRRLDFIFISNNIQEYFKKVSILPSFCSDHSPISCTLESSSKIQLGKNFWKFNSSLINDEKYVTQMKQHISEVNSQFKPAFEKEAHVQWEFLKYEIRKFTIEFSKNKANLKRKKLSRLKVKLTELEQNLSNDKAKEQYNAYRGEINEIYNEIRNGMKIRRKCDWYEFGEKSNKFFLTIEIRRATQNTVRKEPSNEQEITDLSKINTHIYQFYQQLYMEKQNISEDSIRNILNYITAFTYYRTVAIL